MGHPRELVGLRWGRLVVVEELARGKNNNRRVRVMCDCGVSRTPVLYAITSGRVVDCGARCPTRVRRVKKATRRFTYVRLGLPLELWTRASLEAKRRDLDLSAFVAQLVQQAVGEKS